MRCTDLPGQLCWCCAPRPSSLDVSCYAARPESVVVLSDVVRRGLRQ